MALIQRLLAPPQHEKVRLALTLRLYAAAAAHTNPMLSACESGPARYGSNHNMHSQHPHTDLPYHANATVDHTATMEAYMA